MTQPADINQPIIESLYCEALLLADEVRTRFDLGAEERISPGEPHEGVRREQPAISHRQGRGTSAEPSLWKQVWAEAQNQPQAEAQAEIIETSPAIAAMSDSTRRQRRAALSSEGLKTTTRMMYLLAWLLNYRAHFAGNLSLAELRQRAALPEDRPSEPDNIALLDEKTRSLIETTHAIYARVSRLDEAWHRRFQAESRAVG